MTELGIKVIRYDEGNQNQEALKGKYGYLGTDYVTYAISKNILYIVLNKGAQINNVKLPEVNDGFIQLSNGSRIAVNNSILNCSLGENVSGFGILSLKKLNQEKSDENYLFNKKYGGSPCLVLLQVQV